MKPIAFIFFWVPSIVALSARPPRILGILFNTKFGRIREGKILSFHAWARRNFAYIDASRHANLTWLGLAWTFLCSWTEGIGTSDPSTCPFWFRWSIGWKGCNAWAEVSSMLKNSELHREIRMKNVEPSTLRSLLSNCACFSISVSVAWSPLKPTRLVIPIFKL